MSEGWFGDEYLVLFSEAEVSAATERYRLGELLPGHSAIGLRGWNDLIVRDARGRTYTVPAVPLAVQYLAPYAAPGEISLVPDGRFAGKIKWYVKPLVFGGDPNAGENLTWVTHEQHAELVTWWNAKHREIRARGAAGA